MERENTPASPEERSVALHPVRGLVLNPFRAIRMPGRRIADPGTLRQLTRGKRQRLRGRQWQQRGWEQDAAPALYLHEYTAQGVTVRGWVGLIDPALATSTAAVAPHERVNAHQVDDLAKALGDLPFDVAPVLLVQEPDTVISAITAAVTKAPPTWTADDRHDQRHRIWRVDDAAMISSLASAWSADHALLADGHHRFAAEQQRQHAEGGSGLLLCMVVAADVDGLQLGPIHRHLAGRRLEDMASAAAFTTVTWRWLAGEGLSALAPDTAVLTDGTRWATLTFPDARSPVVEQLHETLLSRLPTSQPGPTSPTSPTGMSYHHSIASLLDRLSREPGVGVILPSPRIQDLTEAARLGRLLPAKATSFQPKPSAGVLLRLRHDE